MLTYNVYSDGTVIGRESSGVANMDISKYVHKERKYTVRKHKRQLRCAASLQAYNNKDVRFVTLTISNRNKYHNDIHTINKVLVRWLKNMKQNYGLINYVGVAETQQNGSIHYHFLVRFSNKKIDYLRITNAWNEAIYHVTGIEHKHLNSVRFGTVTKAGNRIHFVNNTLHAIKYITKYISKSKSEYDSKVVFISLDLRDIKRTLTDTDLYETLLSNRVGAVFISDWFVSFGIDVDVAIEVINSFNDT